MKLLPDCFSPVYNSSIRHCLGSCHCGPIFVITKRGQTTMSWTAMNVSCPLATHSVIDGARTNLFRKPALSSLQWAQPTAMVVQLTSSTTAKKYVICRKEFLRKSFLVINLSCSYEISVLKLFLWLSFYTYLSFSVWYPACQTVSFHIGLCQLPLGTLSHTELSIAVFP